jgi:hypothetical protein
MPNITVFLDEETYRRARIWAADRGTSVSAVVKCILVTLPTRASAHPIPPGGQNSVQFDRKTVNPPV